MKTPEARSSQIYLMVGAFNVVLVLVGISLTLWISVADREIRRKIVEKQAAIKECERRVIVAAPPPMVDPAEVSPPQDRPRDGYFGPQGTEIRPALRLSFEVIRSDRPPTTPLEQIRLYSQDVLPRGTIHVVNLWATWCEPCRDEMPDFKAMFARHGEWGEKVLFLPIMVQDAAEPGKAYADLERERLLPPAPIKLADRAMGHPLATALASDAERVLFRGSLPVTLVLDCNRRVRWGHFTQLTEVDFKDLERVVDDLRAELEDTTPGSWCTQPWPGNGRCEGRESTPDGHVVEDCGELKRRPQEAAPEPLPIEPAPPPTTCPEGREPTPDGRCKRKLRGNLGTPPPTKTVKSPTCGNGVCDLGESRESCCDDCLCEVPLVCKQAGDGPKRCMVKGLRGG